MTFRKDWITALLMTVATWALVAGVFLVLPSTGTSQTTRLFPNASGCAVTTTSAQCIGANPTRQVIEICNVGASVVWIAPGTGAAVATSTNSYPLPAIASAVASCYRTPANANVGAGNAWQAISISSTSTLAVFEY